MTASEYSEATKTTPVRSAPVGNGNLKIYWRPSPGPIGRRQTFDYRMGDEWIVERSFAGIYDVARELQRRGLSGQITTVEEKTGMNCLSGDIDRLAKSTVVEDDRGLRIIKWQPMSEATKAAFKAKKEEADGSSG